MVSTFEIIGFFIVLLTSLLGTAGVMVCAAFGGWKLWDTWKRGAVVEEVEAREEAREEATKKAWMR